MLHVQYDQICRNFATWAKFYKEFGDFLSNHLVFGKIVNLLLANILYFRVNFHCSKCPNIEKEYFYQVTLDKLLGNWNRCPNQLMFQSRVTLK